MTIGACVSPPRLAYSLGVEAGRLIADKTPFGKATAIIFDGDGFPFFFGIWAMKILGFESEATEMIAEVERQLRKNSPKTPCPRKPTSRAFSIFLTPDTAFHPFRRPRSCPSAPSSAASVILIGFEIRECMHPPNTIAHLLSIKLKLIFFLISREVYNATKPFHFRMSILRVAEKSPA